MEKTSLLLGIASVLGWLVTLMAWPFVGITTTSLGIRFWKFLASTGLATFAAGCTVLAVWLLAAGVFITVPDDSYGAFIIGLLGLIPLVIWWVTFFGSLVTWRDRKKNH